MTDILYHDPQHCLSLRVTEQYTAEMVAFLEGTVWGTRGVLYNKRHLTPGLERLPAPRYFCLTEDGRLMAVGVCLKKTVQVGSREYAAFYPAALAVDPARRSQGYGRLMVETARPYLIAELGSSGLLYGFVESENMQSLGLFSQVSTHTLGLFQTQIFCRFFPRDDRRVGPAREEERENFWAKPIYQIIPSSRFTVYGITATTMMTRNI